MLLLFLYFLINYNVFEIFWKNYWSLRARSVSIAKRCHVTRGWIHRFDPMLLASVQCPATCWQREQSAHTFTTRSKNRDPSKFRPGLRSEHQNTQNPQSMVDFITDPLFAAFAKSVNPFSFLTRSVNPSLFWVKSVDPPAYSPPL